MIIMGIDPGVARVGWAVITVGKASPRAMAYGCITTKQTDTQAARLLIVYKAITSLLSRYKPDCVSIEDLFFSKNVKTAIHVGEGRGVLLLASAAHNTPVVSYSPSRVKQTVCGSGRAEKQQVQRMMKRVLKLKNIPKPDDTADALAIALTHAYSYKMKDRFPPPRE
jgi:crossover junction endodeoxyribonuclease RuvC